MASFVLDEFLGGGVLKNMGAKFAEDGWDDVPTLKIIGAQDMEALDLTDAQRDALELRIHLHNRSLMKYADRMEASRMGLIDLMAMKPSELASRFKMRKTHVATFVDTSIACGLQMPFRLSSTRRRPSTASRHSEDGSSVRYIELPKTKPVFQPPPFELHKSTLSESSFGSSPPRKSNASYFGFRTKSSPPRRSNAGGDMGYRDSYAKHSPPRNSSAGELRSKNSYVKPAPARASSVGGLAFNGNPFTGDSPLWMSNVAEFADIYVPARKSNAGEFGFNGNPFLKSSPPRKSNAAEFGFNGNRFGNTSPPRKSNAGNPFSKASPPRKSNAAELGFNGNPFGRASPPRKSNAAESVFNGNPFGRTSPPRKSNAGIPFGKASPPRKSNYAGNPFGRASPPRKSNAAELGFYGNPFGKASPPRKSNVGELGFNGNRYLRDSPPRKSNVGELSAKNSPPRRSNAGFEAPARLRPAHAVRPNAPRGVFSAISANKRQLCGMVKAPSSDKVAKLPDLERVMLRQLAPEHSFGVDSRTLKGGQRVPAFKALNLWSEKPTLFFCIRRPGCVMCRAEAHQLFARKPIFDALGVQLVAVLLEDIDEEVWAFWPRYWAGMVVLDQNRDFFRLLGGGKLVKDSLFTGFLLNPIARLNWKRAIKTGIPYNTRGEGTIKGGMFIVRRGRGGVAYQFSEKNFGDWAPLDEVLQVCHCIKEEGEASDSH